MVLSLYKGDIGMLKLKFTDGTKIEAPFEKVKEVNKVHDEYQVLVWDFCRHILKLYNEVESYTEE